MCSSGVCVGKVIAPELVSELRGFGALPGLLTLVTFPSENRALYAQTRRLTLVGLDGDKTNVLDDVSMDAAVGAGSINPSVWTQRPRTFLLPVLDHRVAVVTTNRGIDLFDLAGDKIKPLQSYGFGGSAWQAVGAAGAGSRIFVCTSYEIQAWSLDAATNAITPGATLSMPGGQRCMGLALSADGRRLLAGTNKGLKSLDVSDPSGALAFTSEGWGSSYVVDVQAGPKYIAAYEIRDTSSGYGDVVVLATESLTEVSRFAADFQATHSFPVGFGLLDDDRILLQTVEDDSSGCRTSTAGTYGIAATPVELSRRVMLRACESPYIEPSFHTVASGRYAVIEPMHQLVSIANDGSLLPVSSPQMGSFDYVRAESATTLVAYGIGTIRRIDLSNPAKPQAIAGGPVSPMELNWLRLDVTDPNAPNFVTVKDATYGAVAGSITSLLRASPGGLPAQSGSIINDDAAGTWISSGKFMYQLKPTSSTAAFRIRRFSAAALTQSERQTLVAELDQTITTEPPAALDGRWSPSFSVDAQNGELVILEPRDNTSDHSKGAPVVSGFSLKNGTYERRYSKAFDPGTGTAVRTASGNTVLLVGNYPVTIDSAGNTRSIAVNDNSGLSYNNILYLDDKKLVLAVSWRVPQVTDGVLILRVGDFAEITRYATREPALSFAEVGGSPVFGARSSMVVATPICSAK
jgi:hypothetical protein